MENEVYKAPDSELEVPQTRAGSVTTGVIWGSVIDIGGTTIFGIAYGIGYAIILASKGLSEQEITESFMHIDFFSVFSLVGSFIGCLISFYAGYLCAKKSGYGIKKSTTILCFVSCVFGIAVGASAYSLVENVVLAVLTIAAIVLGSNRWAAKSA